MKQQIKLHLRSKIPQFWETARRYRKLLIGLGISIFLIVIIGNILQPVFFPVLSSTDIVLPEGFFKSSLVFIEKLDTETRFDKPDPSLPLEINAYLEKRDNDIRSFVQKYNNLDFDKTMDQLRKNVNLFPVISNGKERIIIVRALTGNDYSVYLYDTSFTILDKVDIYGSYFQYLASAKFLDRLWIQTGDGGNGGNLELYEIKISRDRLRKNKIGSGSNTFGYETYKIINLYSNPRIIIYKTFSPIIMIIFLPVILPYYFFSNLLYILFAFLFLILCLLLKPHLPYIRTTFLSLFRKHRFD